jgi:P4 family phage/plasmid primase-like protien
MARAANKASLRATLGRASFAAGVERLASTDRAFAVTPELWDRDPWLLGTPGGTVDLRTGELRPARREDYISRQTLVTPAEPDTPCPTWIRFLNEATREDADLIGFIDRWFGYSLTGITREEALTFLFGPGGNGKGVLIHAIFAIMGDYAVNAAIDAFTVTFADKHTTDIAMLNGARMVVATEVEEGRAWAEARIKALTGRDPITARFMRQDNVTFTPIFKLAISGNHKPRLRNVDEAAKRRINMVPFLNRPAVIDPQLAEKLEPEYPAILRRLIGGCISWQTNGLMRPKVVTDATAEYFRAEDYFTRWLDECCTIAPGLSAKPSALLHSFQAWCKANGEEETDVSPAVSGTPV